MHRPYFLVPVGDSDGPLSACRLLVETMRRSERAGLGSFVLRFKEYLVAVRELDHALSLTTMLFHDEVRPSKPIRTGAGNRPPSNSTGRER